MESHLITDEDSDYWDPLQWLKLCDTEGLEPIQTLREFL